MAIWQYRLIFLPEKVLLKKYDLLPPSIPMELAVDFPWWSDIQPPSGFERQIDVILPKMDSWSTDMRMWGQKHGNDACVCYVDESMKVVEEISFRIDTRAISPELVRHICTLARQLECVLLTSEDEILLPDESMVLTAIGSSTSKQFVDDPVATLKRLDLAKVQRRADYIARNLGKNPKE
jgi:hypothetical protein